MATPNWRSAIGMSYSTDTAVTNATVTSQGQSDKDVFVDTLSGLLGIDKGTVSQNGTYSNMFNELWNAYNSNYKTQDVDIKLIPQLIVGKKDSTGKELTPLFNKEFAGYLNLIANSKVSNNLNIRTLGEYISARDSYKQVLDKFQLGDMATNENIDKFLENNVSVSEAYDRLNTAYKAVSGADPIMKEQLRKLGINDSDLGQALLTGKDGSIALENKVREASLRSAEVASGLSSVLDMSTLMNTSLTRETAQAGLSKTKTALGTYQAAASRQGENPADMQRELESENLLGMASQRRAKIASQENNLFSGTSGTNSQVSPKKQALGKF